MANSEPDPKAVGPAGMAWHALRDELSADPAEVVGWAARAIAGKLGEVSDPLTQAKAPSAVKEAKWFLGMIAEIFENSDLSEGDDGVLAFKASLTRRRGRPAKNEFDRQLLAWWGLAMEVETLVAAGDSQKVAVGKVAKLRDVKDSALARWYRERRKVLERQKCESACNNDPGFGVIGVQN